MSIVTDYSNVREIYAEAAEAGRVIPCICSENLTTTEAIFAAADEYADANGLSSVPVTIAMTVQYPHRPQSTYYTRTRRWDIGLRLFRADVGILADAYPRVQALVHLDHVQHDCDAELLAQPLDEFSSIMFDASTLPFEENIKKTAAYVERMRGKIMIEGACDEIIDAGGDSHNDVTTPQSAKRFIEETGADMIVANLGTEHRASGKNLMYHGDAARAIKAVIGPKIVLHGASSVTNDQIAHLASDGVCKVNIWTALERDSTPALLRFLAENASLAAGPNAVGTLIADGYLGGKCATGEKASLSAFTQAAYMAPVYSRMKAMVRAYLDMWYGVK